jgi:hypothetical protein
MLASLNSHRGCSSAQHNISDCVTLNAVRWIGNEAAVVVDQAHRVNEDWSTGWSVGGSPPESSKAEARAVLFHLAEIDYTLQN